MHDLLIRGAAGVHGVLVNGVEVFDCNSYARLERGPGTVLDRFNRSAGLLSREGQPGSA